MVEHLFWPFFYVEENHIFRPNKNLHFSMNVQFFKLFKHIYFLNLSIIWYIFHITGFAFYENCPSLFFLPANPVFPIVTLECPIFHYSSIFTLEIFTLLGHCFIFMCLGFFENWQSFFCLATLFSPLLLSTINKRALRAHVGKGRREKLTSTDSELYSGQTVDSLRNP